MVRPSTVKEFHELNSDIFGVVLVRNGAHQFRSHCTFHSDRILAKFRFLVKLVENIEYGEERFPVLCSLLYDDVK